MVFGTACCIQWPLVLKKLERANRAFSDDVMSAILVYQSNETEAMLVLQTNPLGVEPFSHVKSLFCSKNMHSCWPREWKCSINNLGRVFQSWGQFTAEPRLTTTSVIRSPRYYGHYYLAAWQNGQTFFCKKKKPSLIRSPVDTANFFGPLVTVSTQFHCNKTFTSIIYKCSYYFRTLKQ